MVFNDANPHTSASRLPPPSESLLAGVVALAAGDSHTCGLLTGGGVYCWGWNVVGQLGTGDTSDKVTPTAVMTLGSGGCECEEVGVGAGWGGGPLGGIQVPVSLRFSVYVTLLHFLLSFPFCLMFCLNGVMVSEDRCDVTRPLS